MLVETADGGAASLEQIVNGGALDPPFGETGPTGFHQIATPLPVSRAWARPHRRAFLFRLDRHM
jgi:hypothetical protein